MTGLEVASEEEMVAREVEETTGRKDEKVFAALAASASAGVLLAEAGAAVAASKEVKLFVENEDAEETGLLGVEDKVIAPELPPPPLPDLLYLM